MIPRHLISLNPRRNGRPASPTIGTSSASPRARTRNGERIHHGARENRRLNGYPALISSLGPRRLRGEITVDAHAAQRQAAAPGASAWVSASAGTGKTKVRTDRLLGLMLEGSDPARILCLTFTRAAAAEMANRLNERLADWATLPDDAFVEELRALAGRDPDKARLAQARQLFARVLDIPGGVKIATVHAFCQALLRRFPLEADVSPEFAVLDERGAREALLEAAESVIVAAREEADGGGLAEALAVVAGHVAEERFGMLMAALAGERGKLRRAVEGGYAALRDRLCAALSLSDETTLEGLAAAFCTAGAGGDTGLRRAAVDPHPISGAARSSPPGAPRRNSGATGCSKPMPGCI